MSGWGLAAGKGGGTRALEVLQKPAWRRAELPGDPAFQHPGYAPPRVLWNPHPGPGGIPQTPHLLAPGPRRPRLLVPGPCTGDSASLPRRPGFRGPGRGRGPGHPPPKAALPGLARLGASRRSNVGSGWARAQPGCAPRGGGTSGRGGRGGEPPAGLRFMSPSPRPGGRGRRSFLLACHFMLPSHLHSCVHPFIHTFAFTQHLCLRPLSVQSAPTVCWRALGSSGGAPAQTGIPAPLLEAAHS